MLSCLRTGEQYVQVARLKIVAVVLMQLNHSRRSTTLASGGSAIVSTGEDLMMSVKLPSRLMQCIGRRVRLYRLRAGMTAQELAEFSGITPLRILMFEAGKDTVSIQQLMCIANSLDVRLGDLVRGVAVYSPVYVWTIYPVQ